DLCRAPHRERVMRFVERGEPVHLVLPGFPAKSPNRRKTLGPLPDAAEDAGLLALQSVCDEIASVYPPGARVTICSDGRVFADLVGVSDAEVSAYAAALDARIRTLGLTGIDTFRLDGGSPAAIRALVLSRFGEPLDA